MKRGYKVKIYPNNEQKQTLLKYIGSCRYVYNYFLASKITIYSETGIYLPYGEMSQELTRLRREVKWLSEIKLQSLQQSIRNLDKSFFSYLRDKSSFPRFHKKGSKNSFRKVRGWKVENNSLTIMRGVTVPFKGIFPKKREGTLTITLDCSGNWWASTQSENSYLKPDLNGIVGLDLGLTDLVVTSEGDRFDNIRPLKKLLAKLKKASQAFSRTKKDSKRREKTRLKRARLHAKVANIRSNYLHHVSKAIVGKNHAVIAVEDLAVKNMMQNRNLSRAISDVAWNELVRQITYKQEWRGGRVIKVGRYFPSSKTCFVCNTVVKSLPLSVRSWTCGKCQTTHDRDLNAAKMIAKQAGEQLDVEAGESSKGISPFTRVTRPLNR